MYFLQGYEGSIVRTTAKPGKAPVVSLTMSFTLMKIDCYVFGVVQNKKEKNTKNLYVKFYLSENYINLCADSKLTQT